MRTLSITAALALMAAFGLTAQNAEKRISMRCAGKGCTQQSADALTKLAQATTEGPRASLGQVRSVSMGADGSMTCVQKSGQACTLEQAKHLRDIAAAMSTSLGINLSYTEQQ